MLHAVSALLEGNKSVGMLCVCVCVCVCVCLRIIIVVVGDVVLRYVYIGDGRGDGIGEGIYTAIIYISFIRLYIQLFIYASYLPTSVSSLFIL